MGPIQDAPWPGAVAIGGLPEAAELSAAVGEGRAAGAIVLAPEPGPDAGPVPARRRVEGAARFAPGAAVFDQHTVFAGGAAVVRTRLGAHAVLTSPRVLAVGADLAGRWGWLGAYWALVPIEEFLVEVLERPLVKLPPIGAVRLDDSPGTPQQQLEGRAKDDRQARRRIERLLAVHRGARAPLSVAVVARGLRDDEPVPAEEVWPTAISALADGVAEGVFEPVCHGWLHYDAGATNDSAVEPREFLTIDEDEAGRRIDAALDWQRTVLGAAARSFVAPAWGYSSGALRALAKRSLPAWQRAAPGPLIVDGNPRETLIGAGHPFGGVHGLQYGSLVRLAASGVPPTPVLHGLLLDDRLAARAPRRLPTIARLMRSRDAHRLPSVGGIRWVGAAELIERYQEHDSTRVEG